MSFGDCDFFLDFFGFFFSGECVLEFYLAKNLEKFGIKFYFLFNRFGMDMDILRVKLILILK